MKCTSVSFIRLVMLTLLILGAHPSTALHAQEAFALPEAKAGFAYEFQIQVEGGLPPLKWRVAGGELPPGIELLPSGTLRGVPTVPRRDPYQFMVEVSDSSQPPQTFAQRFSVVIKAGPLHMVLGADPPRTETPGELTIVPPLNEPSSERLSQLRGANAVSATPRSTDTGPKQAPGATPASGQAACPDDSPRACIEGTLKPWSYVVWGKIPKTLAAPRPRIEILVDDLLETQAAGAPGNPLIDPASGRITVWLEHPLMEGQRVRLRPVAGTQAGDWSDEAVVKEPDEERKAECPSAVSDCREPFEASTYLGLAIDTFASGETRKYLNPNAPNGPKERMVGGIDFAYRLMGRPVVRYGDKRYGWPNQLWIYGETVHGVRSTDVDCTKNATFLTCQNALALPTRAPDQILFTFRNATSLEGFAGFRYEFFSLQPRSLSPANLYLKAQAGFLTVSGAPSAAKAIHHVGLGAIATKGVFQDSYLEFGFGRNDLFAQKRLRRWKVDGFVSRRLTQGISFFAQITVDTDIGPGSDSIQSYVGFDFDLRRLYDWLKKE